MQAVIIVFLLLVTQALVYHKGQYWVPFYFYYIYQWHQKYWYLFLRCHKTVRVCWWHLSRINEVNVDKLKAKANKLLLCTEQWSSVNKLTTNFSKCKSMIIAHKLRSPSNAISILINGISILIVNSFRYLSVIMDNKLAFFDPISNVVKNISRSVGTIYKLRHYALTSILFNLYTIIRYPHLLNYYRVGINF